MSEFEDNLWRDVVREHGDDLAQTKWPPPRRRQPRPRVLAGTTVVLAAAAAVIALVLGGAGTSPAYAVTTNHDGSITLAINRLNGIHAANVKLSSLGVRAMAVQVPVACHAAISVARFNPHRIPVGKTLVIAAWRAGHNVRLSSARVGRAGAAACLPPGGNWSAIKGSPPMAGAGAPAPCTVSGPPVTVPAGGGGGTDAGSTESTGTPTTTTEGTGTSEGTGTGTGTSQTTATGTGTSQTTGTGTSTSASTGTGTTGVASNRPLPTVAIPCGYQQRIQASPQQMKRVLALTRAARKNFAAVCHTSTGSASPQTAAAPTPESSKPPAVKIIRCQRPPSK